MYCVAVKRWMKSGGNRTGSTNRILLRQGMQQDRKDIEVSDCDSDIHVSMVNLTLCATSSHLTLIPRCHVIGSLYYCCCCSYRSILPLFSKRLPSLCLDLKLPQAILNVAAFQGGIHAKVTRGGRGKMTHGMHVMTHIYSM